MEKVIIVDSNGLAHRAKYSMKGLSFKEMETGVIFGFMSEILRLAIKFKTTKFIFVWDSKKNYRKEIYPNYKRKRIENKTEEDKILDALAFQQFHLLRKEVLSKFGFKNIFIKTGFEADDIIANIVIFNHKKFNFIILTRDEDLYQLLNCSSIYNPYKKELYTKDDFEKEYSIDVDEWINVKSIAGCKSDNVEGIHGVGEKTAIKYLKKELKKGVALQNIVNGEDKITFNLSLVKLPFKYEDTELKRITPNFTEEHFKLDNFLKMCDQYGFYSFKKEVNLWNKTFKME